MHASTVADHAELLSLEAELARSLGMAAGAVSNPRNRILEKLKKQGQAPAAESHAPA